MRSFLLTSIASIGAINSVYAHPHSNHFGAGRLGRRTVDLDAFRLKVVPVYKNATAVITNGTLSNALSTRDTPEDVAAALIKSKIPGATFRLAGDHYTGQNGISHYYFKQTINGLDVDTGDFNVNIGKDGKVFSFGNSFYQGTMPAPPSLNKRDSVDPVNALQGAVSTLQLPMTANSATAEQTGDSNTYTIKQTGGTVSDPEARLVYVRNAAGELKLSWRIETDIMDNWLLTYVDAVDGKEIHAVVDYKADVSYEVYPWGINDPTEGDRTVVDNPFDSEVSPFGWHSDQQHWYKSTRGNNGMAQTNWNNSFSAYEGLPRPYSDTQKYIYDFSLEETDFHQYANASVTQLFYTANMYHDLMYKLGFTESAGNFEMNDHGEGGIGNDYVILNAQDGSGLNNANFFTPPDGQRPRMRMYIWTLTTPARDGAFEAGVVIHEHTHGLSNRLTGGPANSACLNMLESGGMGEGWSDFMATAIRLKPGDTRSTNYAMGAWVAGNPKGIRKYLYSTDMQVNPQTYLSVNNLEEVHPIGGVWCTMLYEVMWNLIDKYGKNDNNTPEFDMSGVPTDGKYLSMKIVMDAMALQPCNPTFVQARDAIIDADKALTGGANACEIWTAFAKRGLGQMARYDDVKRTASFLVPTGVCNF